MNILLGFKRDFHSLLYFVFASLPAAKSAFKEQSTIMGAHFTVCLDLKQPCIKTANVTDAFVIRLPSLKTQNKL